MYRMCRMWRQEVKLRWLHEETVAKKVRKKVVVVEKALKILREEEK